MLRYILRRLLTILPILLVMSLLTFILMQKTSGSFYDTLKLNPQISPETIERYIKLYQLDKPLFVQYFSWLTNLFHFEFGYSFFYNIPVADVIGGRLWNTFVLSLASLILTWGVAIPLGIYAALHRNKITDRLIQFTSYIALASPTFFVAMLLLYFASQSGILPLGGMHSANYDEMNWQSGKKEDMIQAGIVDPVKVTRLALENAVSIASTLVTTETIIVDKPEPKSDAAGGGMGGGMPGMGGMGF